MICSNCSIVQRSADTLTAGVPRCQRGRWQTAQVRHAELLEERKITALIRAEEVMRMRARRIIIMLAAAIRTPGELTACAREQSFNLICCACVVFLKRFKMRPHGGGRSALCVVPGVLRCVESQSCLNRGRERVNAKAAAPLGSCAWRR